MGQPIPDKIAKDPRQRRGLKGVDFGDTLRQNQDFDELRQKKKQTGSIGKNALKPAVFLGRSKFCLRIPIGKRIRFPNPSAA